MKKDCNISAPKAQQPLLQITVCSTVHSTLSVKPLHWSWFPHPQSAMKYFCKILKLLEVKKHNWNTWKTSNITLSSVTQRPASSVQCLVWFLLYSSFFFSWYLMVFRTLTFEENVYDRKAWLESFKTLIHRSSLSTLCISERWFLQCQNTAPAATSRNKQNE